MVMFHKMEEEFILKKTTCDGQFHMHCADYLVMCIGEFNGHIRKHI